MHKQNRAFQEAFLTPFWRSYSNRAARSLNGKFKLPLLALATVFLTVFCATLSSLPLDFFQYISLKSAGKLFLPYFITTERSQQSFRDQTQRAVFWSICTIFRRSFCVKWNCEFSINFHSFLRFLSKYSLPHIAKSILPPKISVSRVNFYIYFHFSAILRK